MATVDEFAPLDPSGFPSSPLPADRVRGPLVFLDYDQEELDAAYTQPEYAPNIHQVHARLADISKDARRRLGEPQRVAYGASAIECLDIYGANAQAAPTVLYIHGGGWRAGRSQNFAHAAEMFVRAGVNYLVPDFTNVIEEGGNLMPMASQVRAAIAWAVKNAASFGGDSEQIYVCAHSSGAHLTATALTSDWSEVGLPQNAVKGALLVGGMYDLKGPRLSVRSQYVAFTDEVETALSPQRHIDLLEVPLVLAYGSFETPEFQRQSWEFADAVRRANKPVRLIRAEGYNHFETLDTLANPYGVLGRAALEMIGCHTR